MNAYEFETDNGKIIYLAEDIVGYQITNTVGVIGIWVWTTHQSGGFPIKYTDENLKQLFDIFGV